MRLKLKKFQEGWIHHVCRTAVACFLTRGDLWISWVDGLQVSLELEFVIVLQTYLSV